MCTLWYFGMFKDVSALPTFDISAKLSELKHTRQLGSQITLKGASLYDLLGKEVELREKRNNVLARQLEITEVEQALKSSVRAVDDEIKVRLFLWMFRIRLVVVTQEVSIEWD